MPEPIREHKAVIAHHNLHLWKLKHLYTQLTRPFCPQTLERLQRNLSRKTKGSNRRNKAKYLVARLHAKLSDRRLDVLRKLSTGLVRENQTICIEDLNVSGMLQNRRLAKSIADAGWRMFRTLLEGKGELYGRTLKAARNILAAGLGERGNGRGAGSQTGLPASGCEPSTHLNQEVQSCTA